MEVLAVQVMLRTLAVRHQNFIFCPISSSRV